MGKCELDDKAARPVFYAGRDTIIEAVDKVFSRKLEIVESEEAPVSKKAEQSRTTAKTTGNVKRNNIPAPMKYRNKRPAA